MCLEPEYGLVLPPDEPGNGEDPETDDGRVGREDLTVVLRGVAGLYDRDGLVTGQASYLKPSLGGVVEDHGSHRGELAAPDLLAGLRYVWWRLGGLYEEVVPGFFKAEVVVGGAVARGDGYPRLLGLWVRGEVRGAHDLDIIAELRTRR